MGVSAAGKTSVGRALAERLALEFRDADDLHPDENVAKMTAGVPLTDVDRWPWLDRVGRALAAGAASGDGVVMACSALTSAYRFVLRHWSPDTVFVHLTAPRGVLEARMAGRSDHFMPSSLLDSQLATLEPLGDDEVGLTIDVTPTIDRIVDETVTALAALAPASRAPVRADARRLAPG
ncbi:gluconokinase [Microcella alkalica]|nr:gluconokinase [Microcella alkalica]